MTVMWCIFDRFPLEKLVFVEISDIAYDRIVHVNAALLLAISITFLKQSLQWQKITHCRNINLGHFVRENKIHK